MKKNFKGLLILVLLILTLSGCGVRGRLTGVYEFKYDSRNITESITFLSGSKAIWKTTANDFEEELEYRIENNELTTTYKIDNEYSIERYYTIQDNKTIIDESGNIWKKK